MAAAQAAVNIVDGLWQRSGQSCQYANRQFTSDAKRALLDEFPDYCRTENAYDANRSGRRAGEVKINRIISQCSQPVPSPTPPPRTGCGKYTAGTAAAQAAVNIVDDLWQRSGQSCQYANRHFTSDAKRALRNEFPDYCRAENAYDANRSGRRAGEVKINRIISQCSQPVPSPTPPPRTGCGKYTAGTA